MPKILVLTMSGSPEKMKFASNDNERVPGRKLCSKAPQVTATTVVYFDQRFLCSKAKKARNLQHNFAKNTFFFVWTKTLVDCFVPKK